ncbi:mitotic spindle checkpoint protein BUBR1 [Humulus lupulus]|uniref:mitotic spindle checkpoint protein BUBR1 n=1 Tax=Humulus lupulus TaxID=3486 RepID=UPI002B40F831|nr:mitotic spindle checkpoint protein BUBR1 [Humulus lupulus]
MENCEVEKLDPETEFLLSKQETGNEWELFKENVRPLKRGRNVAILNEALKSQTSNFLKNSLLHQRRKLIEAIDDYAGDDPLHPWLQCIKWVQEAFPSGGDSSGLVVIYEQCVRTFWHSDRYKDDLRYLKVWMEYAQNCSDAEIIYSFLDTNEIGKTHAAYYISYAFHMESKNKMKMANDIFNLGISRNAQPIETLKDAYREFLMRSMRRPKANDDTVEKNLPLRSFGTVLSRGENRMRTTDISSKKLKQDRGHSSLVSIYKDPSVVDTTFHHPPDISKTDTASWQTLGSRAERNKENNAKPSKWKAYKVPQKPGTIAGGGSSGCIEVFVDEECEKEMPKNDVESSSRSLNFQLRQGNDQNLKTETELLRENPLRNFPSNSLPR